jgi:hypothetical protein
MAKRKAARAATGRAAGSRGSTAGRRGTGTTKKAGSARSPRPGSPTRSAKGASKTGSTRKAAGGRKTAAGRKTTGARKAGGARKAAAAKSTRPAARKAAKTSARRPSAARRPTAPSASRGATPRSAPGGAKAAVPLRKSPDLNRARRVVTEDEDIVQSTPPSSLDLDRSASAVRTGRKSLRDRFDDHTETSPALTAGDVDADWESAYSVGDEAPGGDNPTPDQDIVDDIGKAVGIEYQDNEELKGANKVEQRDKKRWELDPASSEDWDDR